VNRPVRVNLDFWKFWAGQTVSSLGSAITAFVLPLLIFKLTGSALGLAAAFALNTLPYLLFGLLIGAWIDRVDRKRLMIAVDLARGALVASIPLLSIAGWLTVWWILGVGFVTSTLSIAFNASQFSAIPALVDRKDLTTANGRIQASFSAAVVLGPLVAGLAAAFVPLSLVLLVDSASYLVSCGSLLAVRRRFNREDRKPAARRSIFRDIGEGLRYVLGHPVLRAIALMMALVNLTSVTVGAQTVLFAKQQLLATDSQVGLIFSAGAVGTLVLSLMAGRLRRVLSFSQVALGALALDGLLTMLLAVTRSLALAFVLWALISGLAVLFNINTGSLRQAIVPDRFLGRVVTTAQVLAWSVIPLGSLAGGEAIQWTGSVRLVFGVIGALLVVIPVGFAFTAVGHASRYLAEPQQPAQPAERPVG
jgi:MFS family permease